MALIRSSHVRKVSFDVFCGCFSCLGEGVADLTRTTLRRGAEAVLLEDMVNREFFDKSRVARFIYTGEQQCLVIL